MMSEGTTGFWCSPGWRDEKEREEDVKACVGEGSSLLLVNASGHCLLLFPKLYSSFES